MNTYTNVIVKGPQQETMVAYLMEHRHRSFISSIVNGFTFVYTPFDAWTSVAEEMSRTFNCPALFSFGYDSDVFGYTLYENGQIHDEYESAPDFDATGCGPVQREGPRGGHADVLCAFFGVDHAVAEVDAILHPAVEGPLLRAAINAYDQHWTLAEALGLRPGACVTSYESLSVDEYARTGLFSGAPLIETP